MAFFPSKFKNFGQHFPFNTLGGPSKTARPLRPEQPDQTPPPPPKRRKKSELSPLTSPVSVRSGEEARGQKNGNDTPPPLFLSDDRRHRRRRLSSSNLSSSRDNSKELRMNQVELRQMEKSTGVSKARRHRRKSNNNASAPGIGRPDRSPVAADSFIDEPTTWSRIDGAVDGRENVSEARAYAKRAAPPSSGTSRDTGLTIVLEPLKQRYRDRMMDSPARGQDLTVSISSQPPLQLPRQNGTKRSLYAVKHDNDSVDELSKEYFADRPPAKKQNKGEQAARPLSVSDGPAAAPTRKGRVSTMIESIVSRPLRLQAAFRYPSRVFVAGDHGNQIQSQEMTVDPRNPDVLHIKDEVARRGNLSWLKVDLQKVHNIKFNTDAPVMLLQLPGDVQHGERLGPLMGLQFCDDEDARRLFTWAFDSGQLRGSNFADCPIATLERAFNNALREAQAKNEKQTAQTNGKATKVRSPAEGTEKATKREALSEPNRAPRRFEDEASASPGVSVSFSSPSTGKGVVLASRTRSGRGDRSAADAVDVDASKDSLMAVADGRLEGLRPRRTRSTARLFQDLDFEVERWTETHPEWAANWRIPLTYSRTTVDKDDVARLDEGQFLNDNIINFYLQFLQDTLKKSDSPLAKRVYFHNTFFYEKLKPSKGSTISFDGVKRWTAKVDLFSYDYIVVPVNEHAHWWVAIICNVPRILATALSKADSKADSRPTTAKDANVAMAVDAVDTVDMAVDVDDNRKGDEAKRIVVDGDGENNKRDSPEAASTAKHDADSSVSNPPKTEAAPTNARNKREAPIDVDESVSKAPTRERTATIMDSVENDDSDPPTSRPIRVRDEDNDDDDEVTEIKSDVVASPQPNASAKKPPRSGSWHRQQMAIGGARKRDPKDPRIFTLDSLGSVHAASVGHLKQWLLAEIEARKGVKPADPGRLGMTAKVIPQQQNFCDCGIYLLLYIQEFIRDPDSFIEDVVLRQERKWDTSASDMRQQLRDLILHMQAEYQAAEEATKKHRKKDAMMTMQKRATSAADGAGSAGPPVGGSGGGGDQPASSATAQESANKTGDQARASSSSSSPPRQPSVDGGNEQTKDKPSESGADVAGPSVDDATGVVSRGDDEKNLHKEDSLAPSSEPPVAKHLGPVVPVAVVDEEQLSPEKRDESRAGSSSLSLSLSPSPSPSLPANTPPSTRCNPSVPASTPVPPSSSDRYLVHMHVSPPAACFPPRGQEDEDVVVVSSRPCARLAQSTTTTTMRWPAPDASHGGPRDTNSENRFRIREPLSPAPEPRTPSVDQQHRQIRDLFDLPDETCLGYVSSRSYASNAHEANEAENRRRQRQRQQQRMRLWDNEDM
ncbi:ulp1 protease family protein [Niveomyces insectorum RCEF 264]|uniref:Ulp1 protease family protein n=1 Tax=Niveomyces insectorum RCEF 264 TaxID=1081102 RepID=A0A167Z359_9HYPO|nr:ulp1 protease family protein [Niveomyces insectorum RCEF 264]